VASADALTASKAEAATAAAICNRSPAIAVGPLPWRESKYPKPPYNSPIPFDVGPLPYVQLSDGYQSLFWRCDLEEPIAGGKNVHDPGRKDGAQPR
jgi:hypothetical protein